MAVKLGSLKHHDGQLLARRKDDGDELRVSRNEGFDCRDRANANKRTERRRTAGKQEEQWTIKDIGASGMKHLVPHSAQTGKHVTLVGFGKARVQGWIGSCVLTIFYHRQSRNVYCNALPCARAAPSQSPKPCSALAAATIRANCGHPIVDQSYCSLCCCRQHCSRYLFLRHK